MSEKGTEQGTEQHKKKARQKGDSVRSRELLSAASMLAGVVAAGTVFTGFAHSWRTAFEQSLNASQSSELTDTAWAALVRHTVGFAVRPVGMVMAAAFLASLTMGLAQGGGPAFHVEALGLKFSRLNPITNAGNLVSLRGATRIAKSLLPAAAMVLFGWAALKQLMLPMPVLSLDRMPTALASAYKLAFDAALITLAWSGLDYAVEWVSWNKRMKMTKQQVRDESKEAQGDPHVKGRIRQAQNAIRRRKVKADISKASVIITNPTHYAVALEFSFETMAAPRVLAKGRDLHAAEIREEARWAGVPMIENPPLARSLYKLVEPGQTIPFDLYSAVAGILAFLYRQKVEEKLREERARTSR
jgi:flagellar biosynthetic protein FlhB